MEMMGRQVPLDPQVLQVLMETMELSDHKVQLDQQVLREHQV
jgi:hypothetical protein